jgi:hypothetical protein
MIASSTKLEAGIFLLDQRTFKQYKWHRFVLRIYDKNKQIITKLGPATKYFGNLRSINFGNLTSIDLFLQFPSLLQPDTTKRNSFLQLNDEKKGLHPTETRSSSLQVQIW